MRVNARLLSVPLYGAFGYVPRGDDCREENPQENFKATISHEKELDFFGVESSLLLLKENQPASEQPLCPRRWGRPAVSGTESYLSSVV
jgi:hypothetical protein